MAANGRRQNRRQQVRAGSACPAAASGCRQRRLIIRREFCGFEETSRSNLWRLVSCSVRRQQVRAGSACPNRQCRPSIRRESCGFEETSRSNLWRLVSCAIRRQLVAPGTARPATPTSNPQGILRIRRNQPLQCMAAGFVYYPAAATGCRLSLPAASGRQHC